jgi:hypothetical protein
VRMHTLKKNELGIGLLTLIRAYHDSDHDFWTLNSVRKTIEYMQELDHPDVRRMRDFVYDFEQIFGKMGAGNKYCSLNFLCAFFRVYSQNSKMYGKIDFIKNSRDRIVNDPAILNQISEYTSYRHYGQLSQTICNYLNKFRKNKGYQCSWELKNEEVYSNNILVKSH